MIEDTQAVAHQLTGESAAHAAAAHEAHELPNFLTLLAEHFQDSSFFQFLHRWENLFFSGAILILISSLLIIAARRYTLIPGGFRNFAEALVEGIENFVVGILGEAGRKHVPFLGTLFLYILVMNYCGMIPLLKSPSSAWSTTLALATISVFYIHISGLRALGLKSYLHHITGSPSGAVAWIIGIVLIFPLTLILEYVAVPLSLSLRLFANISSEDRMLLNFAHLNVKFFGFVTPLAFLLQLFANIMAVLFSTVQAFVFTLLTAVYIYTLMPHSDDHASDQPANEHAAAARH